MRFENFLTEEYLTEKPVSYGEEYKATGKPLTMAQFKNKPAEFNSAKQKAWFIENWPKIKRQCKPYIDLVRKNNPDGRLLLRGTHKPIDDAELITPRKNRKPMTSPIEVHHLIDEYLEKKFGWRPRTQGVFVLPSTMNVTGYGQEYMVFPVGKFDFLYAPGVGDTFAYTAANDFIGTMSTEFEKSFYSNMETDELWKEHVKDHEYDDTKQSFRWFVDNNYMDTNSGRFVAPEWFIELGEKTAKVIVDDKLKYTNKNFDKFLTSKSEGVINCKKYWLINKRYKRFVKLMVFGDTA